VRLSDFRYHLPRDRIARYPSSRRGDSRLLCLDGASGQLVDGFVRGLPELLRPGDLLVFNDTRVVRARLHGRKSTGGKVEVLVERVLDKGKVAARIRASKAPRAGDSIWLGDGIEAQVVRKSDERYELVFRGTQSVPDLLDALGELPVPPYLGRRAEAVDEDRYQTVFARRPGAVAAPTAGLHFDYELLKRLRARGVELTFVTLHVGAGTFQPVRSERLEEHHMHSEYVEVPRHVCERVLAARAKGGRIIAVGTTSVRSLETASRSGDIAPYVGETDLFIVPGYRFRSVDALITNFHLPESTLLVLVCAFAGREQVLGAYEHAVAAGYRFFSYGDAMLLTPDPVALEPGRPGWSTRPARNA
jgi:S-adenosylmethionine:tRNA ribosyltransferase-isomerase